MSFETVKWLIHNSCWSLWDKPAGAAVTNASDKFESGLWSKMRGWTDIVPLFGSGENCFDRLGSVRISGKQEIVVNKNSIGMHDRKSLKPVDKKAPTSKLWNAIETVKKKLKDQLGSRDGAVMRALASHQCGSLVRFRPGDICGLSLLLILVLAPWVFLRVFRFSSLHKNQHLQIPIRPVKRTRKKTS